jgi:hypothetical protein
MNEDKYISTYRNFFTAEYITDIVEEEKSPKTERAIKDLDEQVLILMNAIGFLSDFYENDTDDDDPELDDRRPIIKETIKKLCDWFVIENSDQDRRDFIKLNGSQAYQNTKSSVETINNYLKMRGIN